MRVVAVAVSGTHAVVRLRPGWLARLFGAPERIVELEWDDEWVRWRSVTTKQWLRDMNYGTMIRDALEAQPIADLPTAVANWLAEKKP